MPALLRGRLPCHALPRPASLPRPALPGGGKAVQRRGYSVSLSSPEQWGLCFEEYMGKAVVQAVDRRCGCVVMRTAVCVAVSGCAWRELFR